MAKKIDKQVASAVSKQLLGAYLSVENATKIIQKECSTDEFEGFRSEAGKIAGTLYLLLEPLWEAYPDLAAEGVHIAPKKNRTKR